MANVNAAAASLQPYQPGKPIEELARQRGIADAVKLASNENPRGPGPAVRKAIEAAAGDLSRYPDGSGFRLKAALAEHLDVGPEQITLGNGSNDVLELVARATLSAGSTGVVDQHCFVVYPLAIVAAGGKLVRVPSSGFDHDLGAMADTVRRTAARLVYLANPNNPTGTWFNADSAERFLQAVPRSTWVVLDEAYAEYVDRPDYPDGIALQARHPNLIVTRTFSKIHGLAALRVGYGVSSPELADLMNRIRQPFNVSSLGLAAAEAALGDTEFVASSRRLNKTGMSLLEQELTGIGVPFIYSLGNFLTFRAGSDDGATAAAVYDALLDDGVIVRPLANYGLSNHLRVTVGMPEENDRFLKALVRARKRTS